MEWPDAKPFEGTGPREERKSERPARFSVHGRLVPAFTVILIVGLLSVPGYALFYQPLQERGRRSRVEQNERYPMSWPP